MDYKGLDGLLNTIADMEVIVNNVKQDDTVITLTGIEWFKYNGADALKTYACGNHWIGIGANAEHLKVCRRDGAMYYLYRQEGTLWNYYKFLKIRWEGYTTYNGTTAEYALKYEFFLISNGDMFLNVIQTPTNSGYIGTSALVCGSTTIPLTIPVNSTPQISFYHQDIEGETWDTKYEKMIVIPPFERKYLLKDDAGIYYTVAEKTLKEVKISDLNAQAFKEYGIGDMPGGELLKQLKQPKLLFWQDSQTELPVITGRVTAIPPDQSIITQDQDMKDSSIVGIQSVVADASAGTLFAISFDSGIVWMTIDAEGKWIECSEDEGMTAEQVAAVTETQWKEVATTGKYQIRTRLADENYMNNIIVKYKNEVIA